MMGPRAITLGKALSDRQLKVKLAEDNGRAAPKPMKHGSQGSAQLELLV